MIIENENTATRELADETVRELNDGEPVRFERQGEPPEDDAPDERPNRARVNAEVGEHVVETYDPVSVHKDERQADEGGD